MKHIHHYMCNIIYIIRYCTSLHVIMYISLFLAIHQLYINSFLSILIYSFIQGITHLIVLGNCMIVSIIVINSY